MIKKEIEELQIFCFENIEQEGVCRHGFTSRAGGVSPEPYASLNLSYTRGDKKENVNENFSRVAKAIGFELSQLVSAKADHGTCVVRAVKDEKGAPKIIDEPEQYDALITNEEGICLAAFGADCLVNFYLDPEKRAVGISHGGWRGILNGIDREVISAMMREFGTNPKDVQVGVSPSIGPCCFEVDAPVRDEFAKKLPWCARHILPGEKEGKYMIDLWKINRDFLINLGVPLENIYLPDYCTKCHSDVFFSHRAMGDIRGGQGGFIVL